MDPAKKRRLVDSVELAKICGTTVGTIGNLRRAGKIKAYRFIRFYRYDPDEVLAALAAAAQEGGEQAS